MADHPHRDHTTSHLFTVRIWTEARGDGRGEWRGKVQHVLSGEWRYFRDWESLAAYLAAKMQELEKQAYP